MGLISLIVAYALSFYYIVQSFFVTIESSSLGFKIYNILLFTLCLFIYVYFLIKRKTITKIEIGLIIIILLSLIGMILTIIRYGYINTEFLSTVLSFGVRIIPSILIGSLSAYLIVIKKMIKWLQPLNLLYTIALLIIAIVGKSVHLYMVKGFEYQSLSYYAIFAFGINLYLIIYYKTIDNFNIFKSSLWRYIDVILLLIQLYCMFSGGGRGAFILCLCYFMYLPHMVKSKKNKLIFLILSITILVLILPLVLINLENMNGINRLLKFFTNLNNIKNDDRIKLYIDSLNVFTNKPILGHGFGSMMYEFGYYSHNAFVDILVETGLIGLIITFFILAQFFKLYKVLEKSDTDLNVIMIIFLSSFVYLMFSGYYLTNSGGWYCMAFIFTRYYCDKNRKTASKGIL